MPRLTCTKEQLILSRKEHATSMCEYLPIAKALSKMDACVEETVKKFDVAYMLAMVDCIIAVLSNNILGISTSLCQDMLP